MQEADTPIAKIINALRVIVYPIIMVFAFFLIIFPIGLVMRLFGYRPVDLRFDKETKTYWAPSDGPVIPDHFKRPE